MKERDDYIEEVQKLIISFARQNFTQEEEVICLHIWKKLARKKTLDITRTRPDIWAGAVIWAFCRANFKYEEGITLDIICGFYNNKKTTVGNKAGEIIKLVKIDYFDSEYSTEAIQEHNPFNRMTIDPDTGLLLLKEANPPDEQPGKKQTGRKTVEKYVLPVEDNSPQMKLF
jgi:hypothetical protein